MVVEWVPQQVCVLGHSSPLGLLHKDFPDVDSNVHPFIRRDGGAGSVQGRKQDLLVGGCSSPAGLRTSTLSLLFSLHAGMEHLGYKCKQLSGRRN